MTKTQIRNHLSGAIIFLLAGGVWISPAGAQDAGWRSRPFSATIQFGPISNAPGHDLEKAMRASGFADSSAGLNFGLSSSGGGSSHPFTAKGDTLSFGAQYRIRPRLSIGVIYAKTEGGETLGLHGFSQFLFIDHNVKSFAVTASTTFHALRFEVGPAFHQTEVRDNEIGAYAWTTHHKIGFIAGTDLRVPMHTRVFFDLGLQYRYVGRTLVGPYTPSSPFDTLLTFPASQVHFNQWFIGLGPGIRF